MSNEENPVVHTFNSDIQEELNRKDATLLNVATSNMNHIEPTEPPNYKALLMVVLAFVCMGAIVYVVNLYLNKVYSSPAPIINKQINIVASSTQMVDTETFQTLMPSTYFGLNPYMNLYVHNNKYIAYKVSNYSGIVNVLIANESHIKTDMKNYFGKNESFEAFRDLAYNNWDMRIASSTATNTLIYAIANKEYVIFTTSIKDWESAYSAIIK